MLELDVAVAVTRSIVHDRSSSKTSGETPILTLSPRNPLPPFQNKAANGHIRSTPLTHTLSLSLPPSLPLMSKRKRKERGFRKGPRSKRIELNIQFLRHGTFMIMKSLNGKSTTKRASFSLWTFFELML